MSYKVRKEEAIAKQTVLSFQLSAGEIDVYREPLMIRYLWSRQSI